ncbi:hypothetical protein [Mesorhizobium silamurunense]|uniref:hypothetical protein n=1 Tax=Mesorhizobium silamurunense TaxID=499528 RepID=UPI00177F9C5F|nr:hypothetical protein [Mesorhizobium silamurunense]
MRKVADLGPLYDLSVGKPCDGEQKAGCGADCLGCGRQTRLKLPNLKLSREASNRRIYAGGRSHLPKSVAHTVGVRDEGYRMASGHKIGCRYPSCLGNAPLDRRHLSEHQNMRESLVQARGRRLDDSFWEPTRFDFEALVEEAEAFFSNYGFERDFLKMLTDWNREGLRCSDPIVGSYGKIGIVLLIDALDLLADSKPPGRLSCAVECRA